MTEDDVRGLLREMQDDPVPPDSLARIRLAVDARRSRKSRLPWLAALAVTASVAMFAVMMRPVQERPRPAAAIPAMEQPAPLASPTPSMPAREPAAVKKARARRPRPAPESEPVLVRIETADPDIVILLIGD